MNKDSKSKNGLPSEHFMDEVAAAYGTKYDDRDSDNSENRPFLYELAEQFGTSTVRIRKILITKGLYSTAVTREVAKLSAEGCNTDQICEIMSIKPGAVVAAMPYCKGIYNVDPRTPVGERTYKKRQRRSAAKKLRKIVEELSLDSPEDIQTCKELLWDCIILYQRCRIAIDHNEEGTSYFTYRQKVLMHSYELVDEIIVGRRNDHITIKREDIELGFVNALKEQKTIGFIRCPETLACPRANYIYSIFLNLGIISTSEKHAPV